MHSCGSFKAYAASDQFLFLLPKLNCSHSSLIILTILFAPSAALLPFKYTSLNVNYLSVVRVENLNVIANIEPPSACELYLKKTQSA